MESTKARMDLESFIVQMLNGDRTAFAKIYQHFYNPLLRYGLIILPDQKTVEDRIQDLFVWILEHPNAMNRVSNFEIYLFQSLKRNLRSYAKKEARSKTILQQHISRDFSEKASPSFEQQKIEEESLISTKLWVKQKLASLSARQKEIIFLRYYQGMDYDEIADVMHTSNQVVRNYMSRAINRIRRMRDLEKFFPSLFIYLFF